METSILHKKSVRPRHAVASPQCRIVPMVNKPIHTLDSPPYINHHPTPPLITSSYADMAKVAPLKTSTSSKTNSNPSSSAAAPKSKVKAKTTKPTISKPAPKSKPKPQTQTLSPMSRILARGPNGPPVYDELGYEMDYAKVLQAQRPISRRSRGSKKYEAMMERSAREQERKREIMGTPKDNVSAMTLMAWDDRVARELGKPTHRVEMEDYEELARRGFQAKLGEFEAKNISKEECDRISREATGSAFRK